MKKSLLKYTILSSILLSCATAQAEEVPEDKKSPMDKYPESLLYSKAQKVTDRVYVSVGDTYAATYSNAGHNNNGTFIIGDDSVLVVNALSTYKLAKAMHEEIKSITDKPVKYVVVENGQLHALLGASYWQEQGVPVIGHVEAAQETLRMGPDQTENLKKTLKDRFEGTVVPTLDEHFEDEYVFDLGGVTAVARDIGTGHSPGDISVYVDDVIVAGDMAFHIRLLPVFPDTNTLEWLDTWNNTFTDLAKGKIIIPGHGGPTDFETVDKYTRGYLEFIRGEVAKLLEDGGSLEDSYYIDQSAYKDLETYEILAAKNASRVFEAMEFE